MESIICYDITLNFETELFVSVLDEDFEKMLLSMTGQKSRLGSVCTISHDVNITDAPVVPDEEEIENMRKVIFEEMKKTFSKKGNAEVKCTKFIGITKIKRKN